MATLRGGRLVSITRLVSGIPDGRILLSIMIVSLLTVVGPAGVVTIGRVSPDARTLRVMRLVPGIPDLRAIPIVTTAGGRRHNSDYRNNPNNRHKR